MAKKLFAKKQVEEAEEPKGPPSLPGVGDEKIILRDSGIPLYYKVEYSKSRAMVILAPVEVPRWFDVTVVADGPIESVELYGPEDEEPRVIAFARGAKRVRLRTQADVEKRARLEVLPAEGAEIQSVRLRYSDS